MNIFGRKFLGQRRPDQTGPQATTPVAPPPMPPEPLPSGGFRGKTRISRDEAAELSDLLEIVLAPATAEEAAAADKHTCLRELSAAGQWPTVQRLRARLMEFLASAGPADTFEISHGETVVTAKAVECAEALGRAEAMRRVVTVGGAAAGGTLLLLLLGVL